jgi:hypothetical protein
MLAACSAIGIDPAKAFEITVLEVEGAVALYTAQLPFYGVVSKERLPGDLETNPWLFSSHPYGTANFSEGLPAIEFCVRLPWVLSEPNTYT